MTPTRREVLRGVGAALVALPAAAQTGGANRSPEAPPLTLWYRNPAKEWVEALPVGNGDLGAMVFGGRGRERIQLNEHSLWSGHHTDLDSPQTLEYLPKVRQLLFEGRYAEANRMAGQYLMSHTRPVPASYQTLGDLQLEFRHPETAEAYRRELDLDTGIVRTSFTVDDARYTREIFVSRPDEIIAIHLTCDKPGAIAFGARLAREANAQVEYSAPNRIAMRGKADNEGVDFACHVEVRTQGGRAGAAADGLSVEGADSATLILTAATSYKGGQPGPACNRRLAAAAGKSYDALRQAHVAEHRRLFRRAELQIGGRDSRVTIPTDERLAAMQAGGDDPGLIALYFQYGRYLLLSSSRPGTLPANLQGLWADGLNAALVCRLPRQHQHPDELLAGGSVQPGRVPPAALRFRREAGGARAKNRENSLRLPRVRRCTTPPTSGSRRRCAATPSTDFGRGLRAGWRATFGNTTCTAATSRSCAERAYPFMRAAAEFYLDFLVEDPRTGKLVAGPASSPENRFLTPDGESGTTWISARP